MEVMQFGKFRGMMICDIPTDYLQWGANALKGSIQRQFSTELASRTGETPMIAQATSCGSWDCSRMFDESIDWPEKQAWDGYSAPWMDQVGDDELSVEFNSMFG